jgi:hypothetical protein
MHNVVYGTFGIDGQPDPAAPEQGVDTHELVENTQTACVDYLQGPVQGGAAALTGSNLDVAPNGYWTERYFFDRALANYKGSVFLIQGLQDWNVKPHVVFPRYQQMQQAWETRGLFGQWNHMYPDRPSEHVSTPKGEGHEAYPASVRYDWAQMLLEWFDYYLKGEGPKPALTTEIQDNMGHWRSETGPYPATDAAWLKLNLGTDFAQASEGQPLIQPGSNAEPPVNAPGTPDRTPPNYVIYASTQPLAAETHVSGLAGLALQVTPLGSGGQVYAELRDLDANLRFGHAIMDLRYAAGQGEGTADAEPVVPGMPLTAHMQFEVMDAVVPAGHRLQLLLTGTGRDYLPSADAAPVLVDAASSVLSLPTIPATHGAYFLPPAWSGNATATAPQP